jgi:hypothetical protein
VILIVEDDPDTRQAIGEYKGKVSYGNEDR